MLFVRSGIINRVNRAGKIVGSSGVGIGWRTRDVAGADSGRVRRECVQELGHARVSGFVADFARGLFVLVTLFYAEGIDWVAGTIARRQKPFYGPAQ